MYGESTHQILNHMHFLKQLTDSLEQWFLTFPMLRPLNTVPHVVGDLQPQDYSADPL